MAWALQRAHLHFQGLLASPHPLQQRAEVTEVGGQELPLSMDSKGESSPHLRPADHPSEMRLPLANTAFHGLPTPPNPSVLQHSAQDHNPTTHLFLAASTCPTLTSLSLATFVQDGAQGKDPTCAYHHHKPHSNHTPRDAGKPTHSM